MSWLAHTPGAPSLLYVAQAGAPPAGLLDLARRVLVSVPLGHSHKPPLCGLLRPLLCPPRASAASATDAAAAKSGLQNVQPAQPGQETPLGDEEEQRRAWRALPKLELFARELRPGWHSAGNEVLRFQHESFWEPKACTGAESQAGQKVG